MLSLGVDVGGTSIKAALMEDGVEVWSGRSGAYARPDREALLGELRGLVQRGPSGARTPGCVGLCVPGLRARDGRSIEMSVNVPGLSGLEFGELVKHAGVECETEAVGVAGLCVVTDASAAAFDYAKQRQVKGRLLALSLGTGVGACVLDDGEPLVVSGGGPGHLGQVDVSGIALPGEPVPMGPDGGRGSLEAYVGLPALRERYGDDVEPALNGISMAEPMCRALVRVIRVAHAIYRPDAIVLLGGIGIRLGGIVQEMREAASRELTSVARAGWTLTCGDSDFHAARGAARLAAYQVKTPT